MGRIIFLLAFYLMLGGGVAAEDTLPQFQIRYLSQNHVYINAGSSDGLAVGDTLSVVRDGKPIAQITVAFLSENSASCELVDSSSELAAGDLVIPKRALTVSEEKPDTVAAKTPPDEEYEEYERATEVKSSERGTRLGGSVSAGIFYWDDREATDLDFYQPAFRLSLTADRLWGNDLSLRIRSRTRFNKRSKQYSSSVPRTKWRNTIYEFSIGSSDDDGTGFRVGRIIPRRLSGIGYLDGLFLQKKVYGALRVGVFGGTQPEWQYAELQSSIQKYGIFFTYSGGERTGLNLESTVALAAEYHSSVVSREFVHIRNDAGKGSRVRFYQSADIDINRGWRSDKANEKISLSNIYLSARYVVSRLATLGLTFDNRKRYWTYEQRTLADSLFDDYVRRGARASIDLNLPWKMRAATNFGLRKREGDLKTSKTYAVNLNKANFPLLKLNLNLYLAGFSSPYSDGFNISYGLGKYFRRGHNVAVSYGIYSYNYTLTDSRRSSRSITARGNIMLPARMMFSWEFRNSAGDDIDGRTVLAELGYRIR